MSIFDTLQILLIEDDPDDVHLITHELMDKRPAGWIFNYKIKKCSTLKTAKKYLPGGFWDVVILDLHLSDSQGYSTFEEVIQIARAPVVVLTGSEDYDLLNRIEDHSPGQRCYIKQHIARCWFFLHYIIKNTIREKRRNYQLELLQGASLDELRNIAIHDCANCGKWKHPTKDTWLQPIDFLSQFDIYITTGICPDCQQERYGHLLDPSST